MKNRGSTPILRVSKGPPKEHQQKIGRKFRAADREKKSKMGYYIVT